MRHQIRVTRSPSQHSRDLGATASNDSSKHCSTNLLVAICAASRSNCSMRLVAFVAACRRHTRSRRATQNLGPYPYEDDAL